MIKGVAIMTGTDDTKAGVRGSHRLPGPHADELFNLFTLAIHHESASVNLKKVPCACPTAASDTGYMARVTRAGAHKQSQSPATLK